jgi:hypothetical protein
MDVRRLAAIDMHGAKGSLVRRRVILAEFVLGAVVMPVFGAVMLVQLSGVGWKLFGLWLLGAGLNYVPLALHAISFSRRGALGAELAGADVPGELRYYTKAQVWVFVPLALVVFALRQRRAGAAG